QLTRHWMHDTRRGVPTVPHGIMPDFIPRQHRITTLQRTRVAQDRLRRLDRMMPLPPLMKADPEHQFRDLPRPWLHLDAVELPGTNLLVLEPDRVAARDLLHPA